MEFNKIEIILEKYFKGETSINEENELKLYFSSTNIAKHLIQYQSLFSYFEVAKKQNFKEQIPLKPKKRHTAWLSIAASIVVLLGIGTFAYFNFNDSQKQDLGTYNDPEIAFQETQKALSLLSENVNVGVESVQYIQEYEIAKEKVFAKF